MCDTNLITYLLLDGMKLKYYGIFEVLLAALSKTKFLN